MELIKKNTWVEVENKILNAKNRSDQLPVATQKVPFEMKVRGILTQDAYLKDVVTIKTNSGRMVEGKLVEINPGYTHSFGPPVEELLHVGEKEKCLINDSVK